MSIKNIVPIVGSYDCHKSCMLVVALIILAICGLVTPGLLLYYLVWAERGEEIGAIPVVLSVLIWITVSAGMVLLGIFKKSRSMFVPMIVLFALFTTTTFTSFLLAFKFYLINVQSPTSDSVPLLRKLSLSFIVVTVLTFLVLLYLIGLFVHHSRKWVASGSQSSISTIPLVQAEHQPRPSV